MDDRSVSTVDPDRVIDAVRASWCRQTSAEAEVWTDGNPAKGQCDVSSFVAWEYLGGELVLSQVFVDGEPQEHHYWNRIDGTDLDLTREQDRIVPRTGGLPARLPIAAGVVAIGLPSSLWKTPSSRPPNR